MEIEKEILRIEIRKRLTVSEPETASVIRSKVMSLDCWGGARTIFAYHPLPTELDLLPMLDVERGKDWIFPRVSGESLSLHLWSPGACWRKGAFGILEPDPMHWPEVGVEAIDVALIPGMAFDRNGKRLGRGRGFYDRLLASPVFRALKVGITTDRFLLDEIPIEAHDIPMDLVVTESGIVQYEGSRLDNGFERE